VCYQVSESFRAIIITMTPCVTILPIAKPAMGDVERRALGRIYFEAGESNVLWSRLHTISNRVSSEMFIVAKKKVVYKA
jgi:hypothetical protein